MTLAHLLMSKYIYIYIIIYITHYNPKGWSHSPTQIASLVFHPFREPGDVQMRRWLFLSQLKARSATVTLLQPPLINAQINAHFSCRPTMMNHAGALEFAGAAGTVGNQRNGDQGLDTLYLYIYIDIFRSKGFEQHRLRFRNGSQVS